MKIISISQLAGTIFLLLIVFYLSGCAGYTGPWQVPCLSGVSDPGKEKMETEPSDDTEMTDGDESDEHSVVGTILLYLPNRICDAVEIVRAGVNVGLGLGVDARATWVAQGVFIHDSSLGVGFQGFRHLPVCSRFAHSAVGVGPIKTPSLGILDWPINDYDIRVELFVAVVGAHVAVDLGAIGDFLAGLFLFDPSEDDFVFGG